MIVIMLMGGMGNQMFQYAFGRYLSLKYNVPLFLNKRQYDKGLSERTFDLGQFQLDEKVSVGGDIELARNIFSKEIIRMSERQFHYDTGMLDAIEDTLSGRKDIVLLITGYWQSYKYFSSIESTIRADFRFRRSPLGRWDVMRKKIKSRKAVMVNVRRTDFVVKKDFHGVVSRQYLADAIAQYRRKMPDAAFFVFSDDIPWCIQNLSDIRGLSFIDERYYGPQFEYYFQLMCSFRYFILANSTFSWWAAWLSPLEQKEIMAPAVWFTERSIDTSDLLPPEWVRYQPDPGSCHQ
jgi:hypothetical protein